MRAGAFEEYRYDALGRRIMRRVRQDSTCTVSGCISAIERFVWDGSQLLYELRGPGESSLIAPSLEVLPSNSESFGVVGYTHGLGIDRPLSIRKGAEFIVPHANWRGVYAVGTALDGSDDFGCGPTGCTVPWPAPYQRSIWYDQRDYEPAGPWYGSLILGKRDASGLLYMRNRYYDPQSGRFTQEDPIGLAGGLNAYGFANGDPVNYGDPFGLCPPCNGSEYIYWFANGAWDAVARRVGNFFSHFTAGVSVTHLNATVSGNMKIGTSQGQVSRSLVLGVPQIGASVDLGVTFKDASQNAVTGSVDFGLGDHLGVSFNTAVDKEGAQLTGLTLHVGTPWPVPVPLQGSIDVPTSQKPLIHTWSCAKSGSGCTP